MLVLPIPLIVSAALGFLFLQTLLRGDRPWLFAALLASCAMQGIVISLAQHYGVASLRLVQPVTASIIPPLAWVTFQATAVRSIEAGRDLPQLAVPAFVAFCTAFAPATLDVVVPAVFLAYGLAILRELRAGDLPLMRLEAGDLPRLIWRAIALALVLSGVGDGLIAVALLLGADWMRPWIISLFSSLSLLLVGGLALSRSLAGDAMPPSAPEDPAPSPGDPVRDAELMDRLDALLDGEALYLDPGLTLARLARRLHVPAKQLSAAVNRTTGGNVPRHVNAFRIRHACARLRAGDSVTAAMLDSGFNTKSNFNREFLRITGKAPSAWLAEQQPEAAAS